MKKRIPILLSAMILLTGCASQRDVITLDNRLAKAEQRYRESEQKNKLLEAKLNEYREIREASDQELRSKTAGQNATLDQLQEEIRILSGRLDETEHFLNQKIKAFDELFEKSENIDKTANLNKDRIARLEQYLNFESSEPGQKPKPVSDKPLPKQAAKTLSEDDVYLAAKKAYDNGDLNAAREGFKNFLKQYPKSENADNAQFWIGETYYREKWYEKAILEYQKVIEAYPKGNKIEASLLKQGFAFFNLGDKANARLILSDLIKKYPKSNEANIAENKLKAMTP